MANLQHPTTKPAELVERALRNSSKTRDTILDPFGVSGTTLIACEHTNREARVIELDPKYCDVIVRWWQEDTGDVARHADSGPRVQRSGYGYFSGAVFDVKPIPPARQSPSMTSIDLPMPLHTRDMLVPGPTSLTHAGGVSEKAHFTARTGLPTRKEI